jgi:hypothetical protein
VTIQIRRRIERLENIVEERRLRPIREKVVTIMHRMGAVLPPSEVEDIVRQHASAADHIKGRIKELGGDGLSDERILEVLPKELATRLGVEAVEV